MLKNFEPLTISDIRKETNDCVSIAFDIPAAVKNNFQFTQGQHLTLKTKINGEEIRRSYSICSSPFDNEIRVAIKKVPNGIFSTYANEQLRKGNIIEVMPPSGKFFTPLDAAATKQYIAFAAGSGITPIFSIIKTTLLTEPNSSFTLVYGNKNRHSIIFKEALEALKNRFMGRLSIVYILSREKTDASIHFGRIDAEKCEALCKLLIDPKKAAATFLCGPETMIFDVKNVLQKIGVDEKNIHFELFAASKVKKNVADIGVKLNNTVQSNVTVKQDGISFDFNVPFEGESILEAALKSGADLPFACKGGVCCTCKAKLIEGEVDMDVHYGLEQEEIEHGFILTCQSHPRTEKIVIDFDSK
ncbi:MAG: ring-1 2-phenylacetyl-CoA epoxidase subunit PaaE [Chitinophagaceae bacterium]|nr:MAG: ring-1 2-phenylacetyl-CoA epoxidase subunit PaaE [Chitinophagaceae bacterium]